MADLNVLVLDDATEDQFFHIGQQGSSPSFARVVRVPEPEPPAADAGTRIYIDVFGSSFQVNIADYTQGAVNYDPAQTELVLLCSGAAGNVVVTMATDAARVVGARVTLMKTSVASYTMSIASPVTQLNTAGQVTATPFALIGSTFQAAFTYSWSGAAWLSILPRSVLGVNPSALETSTGFSVIGKATTGTGQCSSISSANDQVLGRVGTGDLGFTGTPTVTSIGVGGNAGPKWSSGNGTPEGVVTAPIGSLYSNTAGGALTTLYVKTSGVGNTGWTAK